MQKLIELKKDEEILVSSKPGKYLKPDYVYIPVKKEDKLLVKPNEKVKIGSNITTSSISPVSGVVRSLKKMMSFNNALYYLEIENDFEEQRVKEGAKKRKFSKEEVFEVLSGKLKDKKNLVLNAIDDELYVVTENFYLFLYYDVFLELLDDLDSMFHLEHIIVCVSASSSENISNLMSDLGMYPHIELKMVPSLYLLGKTEFLLSYLGMDEKNTVVIKASRFYDAYNTLKRGRCPSDKLFTISGNAIKNPMVIQSKIGVLLKDIIKELIEFKEKDFLFIAGGLMQGKIIDIDNFVITHSLNSILVMKKEEAKKSLSCLKCGACHDICPKGLYPNLFSDPVYFEQKKNICLKCGLCSYICPVYINFNKYWKGENNE